MCIMVRKVVGYVLLIAGVILILIGVLGVLAFAQQGAQEPGAALVFVLFWWLPLIIFGVPGLILGYFGYKLVTAERQPQPAPAATGVAVVVPQQAPQPQAVRVCPKCGRQVPVDARLCPYCGAKLEGSQ